MPDIEWPERLLSMTELEIAAIPGVENWPAPFSRLRSQRSPPAAS
jgi:hypothetical protein